MCWQKVLPLNKHVPAVSISSHARFISCHLAACQWPQEMLKLVFVAELTAQLHVHLKICLLIVMNAAGKGSGLERL